MLNHNDLLIEKHARADHAELLKQAEINRLPGARVEGAGLLAQKLALVAGAVLAALLIAQAVVH